MDKINNRFTSIEQVASQYMTPARNNRETSGEKSASFQDILLKKQAQESGELKFSKHASHHFFPDLFLLVSFKFLYLIKPWIC